jgi:hypothetical protein
VIGGVDLATTVSKSYCEVQVESRARGPDGGTDASRVGSALRRAPEPSHLVEEAIAGKRLGCIRVHGGTRHRAVGRRSQGSALQDWPAGHGDRFFRRSARSHQRFERKTMIDRDHRLPVKRQAPLLDLSRSLVTTSPGRCGRTRWR